MRAAIEFLMGQEMEAGFKFQIRVSLLIPTSAARAHHGIRHLS